MRAVRSLLGAVTCRVGRAGIAHSGAVGLSDELGFIADQWDADWGLAQPSWMLVSESDMRGADDTE